jgi:hypothetical protein
VVNLTREELQNAKWIHANAKYGHRANHVHFHAGNTAEHEILKALVVWEAIKNGSIVYTEAIFKQGGRADIVDITEGTIIEILGSEKENDFLKKSEYYPSGMDLIPIKTTQLNKYLKKYKR